jgi:hypothetical protein
MWIRSLIDSLTTRASRKRARQTSRSPKPSCLQFEGLGTASGPFTERCRSRPTLDQLESREVPAQLSFAVNEFQSSVTLNASVPSFFGTVRFQEQGAGSLTTAVDGTIVADVNRTSGTIQFLNSTDLVLANSGWWQPMSGGVSGSEAANFGGVAYGPLFTILAAIRHGEISLSSGSIALGSTDPRSFDTSQIVGVFTAGALDSNYGTASLTGFANSNSFGWTGSLAQTGTSLTLTIPVDINYSVYIPNFGYADLNIAGSLQATAKVPFFVVSVGGKAPVGVSQVQVFDVDGVPRFAGFDPYSRALAGGVRTAVGDLTGDGIPDIVAGPGLGVAAKVKLFSGADGAAVGAGFFPYGPAFNQGINVAVGNVVDDHISPGNEIIVSAAGRKIKVFDENGVLQSQFSPFGAYMGTVRLAVGNVNGTGLDEIVVTRGAPVRVRIYSITGSTASQVMPELAPAGVKGNPYVAVGNVLGSAGASIILGDAAGGQVRVFRNDGTLQQTLPGPYGGAFTRGVRVGVMDVNNDGVLDILTAPGATGGQLAKAYRATDGTLLDEFSVFDKFNGGFFVAGSS